MIATISDGFDNEKLLIKGTYSNTNQFFKNKTINVETSREISDSSTYNDLKNLTNPETTPLKSFDKIIFKQSIYPKNLNTYSKNHRTRPEYSSKVWRDERESRTELELNNGFGFFIPSQSFWPLDAEEDFTTRTKVAAPSVAGGGGIDRLLQGNSDGGCGILQNTYSLFASSSNFFGWCECRSICLSIYIVC